MRRLFLLALLLPAHLVFGACAATGDDDDDGCQNETSEYSCENGVCACADETSCTNPDDTTSDDADSCDNACVVCND